MVGVRAELYPFVGTYHDVNGHKLHALDEGRGDAIVMLHGNPTWSFFFRNLVLGLRHRHRIIVPDHIGCGLSDKPDEARYDYSLRRRVDDLEALLERLGIEGRFTLLMHDWGGMIGMAYAVRHPHRINRLVLMNTAAFHLPKSKKLPRSLWLCRKTPLGSVLIRDTGLFNSVLARWAVCKPMDEEVRAAYLQPYRAAQDRTGVLRFVQDIPLEPGDPSYDLVSEVQSRLPLFAGTPALILWGERDFVFDEHFLREWRKHLPQAEVHRFPQAGHYLLEDAGAEILPLVDAFLERHPAHA